MTLGAMTVAIGRVVDDSIVVIENIYRRMSLTGEQLKGKELILEATKEMFVPIMSSTIVTIAVFLPLALVSGQVGELFLPFALDDCVRLAGITARRDHGRADAGTPLFKKRPVKATRHSRSPGVWPSVTRDPGLGAQPQMDHVRSSRSLLLAAALFLVPLIGASFMPEEEQKCS